MIEINEIMPLYLCRRDADCSTSVTCANQDEDCCKHTTCELYAKNADAVMIFNLFADTFDCVVDENGRLVITEKENK